MPIILMLIFSACASAQTNLGTITFTNKTSGTVVRDAIVTKNDRVRLTYKLEGGGGGTVRLAELPEQLQTRFGYSLEMAINADTEARLRAKAYRRQQAVAADTARVQVRRKEVEATMRILFVRVMQRTGEELLVNCDVSAMKTGAWREYLQSAEFKKINKEKGAPQVKQAMNIERGIVYIVDHPNITNLADDDEFVVIAYPIGTHEYTAVSGGKKTVRKYTCNLERAIAFHP